MNHDSYNENLNNSQSSYYEIPLTTKKKYRDESISGLIKDTLIQSSNLIRTELTLAKSELSTEVKKSLGGAILIIIALTLLIFSSMFFFITLAEILDIFLPRWAAFLIVFILIILISLAGILLAIKLLKTLRKPERTITSIKKSAKIFKNS